MFSNIRYSPNTQRIFYVFSHSLLYKSQQNCYALGFELSLPQSSNNPTKKLVSLTPPHTNKQTNNQTPETLTTPETPERWHL
jgi:hypothetical protein